MPETLRCRLLSCLFFTVVAVAAVAKPLSIRDVHVTPAFFNPSLAQAATLSFMLAAAGDVSITVVDRDGFPVRALMSHTPLAAGRHTIAWNGKTDGGGVVADEAWSFKIDFYNGKTASEYFPAADDLAPKMTDIRADSWDPVSGILRYTLPFAARVHIQAGSATVDPKTNAVNGPVLKTIVNREPRIGGAVIEQWDGLDESRTIRVTDLPHFAVAIAATPLPESSVITVGNRKIAYVATIAARKGASLLPVQRGPHVHHQGLTAVQDVSPPLQLQIRNAKWSASGRKWVASGGELDVQATAAGPSAAAFVAERGGVQAFIDGKRVKTLGVVTQNPVEISVPIPRLAAGTHILAINWGSPFGPVAVNSLRFATDAAVTP